MTAPASAEPTEGDWDAAEALSFRCGWEHSPVREQVARALASQRAEIVARYEKVAEYCEQQARGPFVPNGYSEVAGETWGKAGKRIREAAPNA